MNYGIFLGMLISFCLTYFALPSAIKKLKETGQVVRDRYKQFHPKVPTQGGAVLLFSVFFTLVTISLWFRIVHRINDGVALPKDLSQTDTSIMLVIAMFAIYGIVDDLIDIGHFTKIVLPFFFSYPLLVIVTPENLTIPFYGEVNFSSYIEMPLIGRVYLYTISRILLMPLFIMVITNLVNMHSGLNGLQTGLSSIILTTILIKSILDGRTTPLLVPAALLGGLLALWLFNKFPAKILEGNIGSFFAGSTIGCILVVQGYLLFGVIIFIPHIIDFLMFIYIKIRKKEFVKFGSVRTDGTIVAPNPVKMKFLLPYYFKLTEKQTVLCLYGITAFFCALGLAITI